MLWPGLCLDILRHCFAVADGLLCRADRYRAAAIETVYRHCLHLDGSTYASPPAHARGSARPTPVRIATGCLRPASG